MSRTERRFLVADVNADGKQELIVTVNGSAFRSARSVICSYEPDAEPSSVSHRAGEAGFLQYFAFPPVETYYDNGLILEQEEEQDGLPPFFDITAYKNGRHVTIADVDKIEDAHSGAYYRWYDVRRKKFQYITAEDCRRKFNTLFGGAEPGESLCVHGGRGGYPAAVRGGF